MPFPFWTLTRGFLALFCLPFDDEFPDCWFLLEPVFFTFAWTSGSGAVPKGRWFEFHTVSSWFFSACFNVCMSEEYTVKFFSRYCWVRILSDGSTIDKVFSIFSTLEGSFLQNRILDHILWTTLLNSSTVLKSYKRKWFHLCVASGRIIALCCSYRFLRDVHKARESSSYMYSIFISRWIWFLITFKVE